MHTNGSLDFISLQPWLPKTAQNWIRFIDSCIQWCNVSGTSLISDYDIIMYFSFSWYQIQFYYLPKWKLPNRCHANVAAQMCLSLCVSLALNSSWKWGKKMCHAYFPTFFISFLSFQLLSPSSPCHCTARTPNKTRTSKKCLLNCVCQLDVRFQNVRCAKVRRAPPDIPNVGAGQKTFLKLVKYLWFWSHWRMKKKKLREREKKQEKSKEGKI